MKYSLLLITVFYIFKQATGQSTVNFTYDYSGNRTSRAVINLKSTSSSFEAQTDSVEESFSEKLGDYDILVYPNPVESELTIEIHELDEYADASTTLFDQGGRLIMIREITPGHNKLDLSYLSAGSYYMVIRVGGKESRWTIVKE